MKFAHAATKLFSPRHRVAICLFFIMAIVALAWSAWIAIAGNRTWTGGTPGDAGCASPNPAWVNPCNWTSKILPIAGDDLTFGSSLQPNSVNNFANGTTFNSLSVSGGHSMTGNSVSLNAGLTATNAVINLSSLKLNNNQTFTSPTAGVAGTILSTIDTNGKILTAAGPGNFNFLGLIAGSGRLNKTGSGLTILTNNNTYTGQTGVDDGTLLVVGSQSSSSVNVFGGTLGGTGTVGSIQAGSGGTISPGGVNHATGALNVDGDVILSTSSTTNFDIDLNGVTAGSGYDQINVNGIVTAGLSAANSPSSLNLTVGFTPPEGATFVIINKSSLGAVSGEFAGHPDGSFFLINNTIFFITYKGGDGNDVVLHVPEFKTWIGGGANNHWTTAANWTGGSAPQAGDNLVFPSGVASFSSVNDFPSSTSFESITISGGGYSLTGNGISLFAGILEEVASGQDNSVSIPIKLLGSQGFHTTGGPSRRLTFHGGIDTNGNILTLEGTGPCNFDGEPIVGTGRITRIAAGQSVFSANNTYSGITTVSGGTLIINGVQPTSAVSVFNATLAGEGTTGSITVAGGQLAPGDVHPILTVNGNVTLTATHFVVNVVGDGTNRQFTSLNVTGAVDVGNAVLNLSAPSPLPAGNNFIIINNAGGGAVSGTFNDMPEGSSIIANGQRFVINYHAGDGNDVALHIPATRTWSGAGTTNSWSEGANWVGGVAPVPGDDLVFPSGAARKTASTNDFANGTTFNSISLTDGGYSLLGNGIRLTSGIVDSVGNSNQGIFFSSITVGSGQTFSELGPATLSITSPLDTNSRNLTLDGGAGVISLRGIISGNGNLIINGTGIVDTFLGNQTSTLVGNTVINSGSYFLGRLPNSPITLHGGTLTTFGNNSSATVAASGGVIYQYVGTTTINGNLTLTSNVTYRPRFDSSIGSLNVSGTVNLADSALDVEVAFTSPPSGNSFMIINKTSAGAVQGTFKNLPEGATFMAKGFPFRISYVGGDGNDVVLTPAPPIIYIEQGTTNRAVTLDSVTFVRNPLPLNTDYNFGADHRTRVVFLTSSLGLSQPDPSVLTVQAAGFNLTVEGVGPFPGVAGLDGSYIVVRLPEGLTTGDLQMAITLRGLTSNTAILRISP